jgi:hypothetical protein
LERYQTAARFLIQHALESERAFTKSCDFNVKCPAEQLIEIGAQRTNIAAAINVLPVALPLLSARCIRGCRYSPRRVHAIVARPASPEGLARRKSITFTCASPHFGRDQGVSGFEIAVKNPLLVRLLNRRTPLRKQLQKLV